MSNRGPSDPVGSAGGEPPTDAPNDEFAERPGEVLERVSEAFFAVDEEWRFTYLNSHAEMVLEASAEELVGENVWELFPAAIDREFYDQYHRAMETQEPVSFEEYFPPLETWFEVSAYPSESGLSVYFRDVTERHHREQQLQNRIDQQEAAVEFGREVMNFDSAEELFETAVSMVSDALDTPFASVFELEGDDTLVRRAAIGWDEDVDQLSLTETTHASETIHVDEPVVVSDFETSERFEPKAHFRRHGIRSGVSVVIGTSDNPWGLLSVHGTESREFTDNDATFIQNIANTLMSAIERDVHERALLQQGRQLAALNQLNTVAREINHAIARESTREEVEQLICNRLTGSSSSYQLAWTGEVSDANGEVVVSNAAGATGYLEGITIPFEDGTRSPAGKAIRTGDTQVVRDLTNNPEFEPWQDLAESYGLQSVIVVPIEYEGALYGIFALYSDRDDAFTGEELAVIEDLGEIVGHTIQSLERKRLLMTDEVVRVDVRVQEIDDVYDIPRMSDDDRVAFEEIISLNDGEFLTYGTSTLPPAELEEVIEAVPQFDDVKILEEVDDEWRFTIHLVEPPALSTIAAHGGRVDSATVEGGNYRMTIELPVDVEARTVLDPIRESYPSLETLAQRRVTSDHGLTTTPPAIDSELTDRQRAVLEAAYFGGYFEWPRDIDAEELAEQMGVSSPTLHEHLRNAQRKAFAELLEE